MAAALPVVASPIGFSINVVTPDTGFLATSSSDWTDALTRLIRDAELRDRMGRAGRAKVEREFSLTMWGPKVSALLVEAARKPRVDK
jgi:glycosyltransferase involved in cell wall biosynthesis